MHKDGISTNASIISVSFTYWSAIEKIGIERDGLIGPRKIVIKLKERTDSFNRFKGVKKRLLKFSDNSVYIRRDDINISINDLYEIIQTSIVN